MRNIRLALLLCDDIILKVVKSKGEYANMFRRFLSSSLESITDEVTFTLDAYDVYEEMVYPSDDDDFDGLLISGSSIGSLEEPIRLPWVLKLVKYLQRILTEKPSWKIFGICFGHQAIAKALGSSVESGDWEISVTPIHLTKLGKVLFHCHKIQLQMFHQREVTKRPPHAHIHGSSDTVDNQGYVIFEHGSAPSLADLESDALHIHLKSIRVLTFQGHPELTEPIMRMLIAKEADKMPQDMIDDALSRVGWPTDAMRVGKVMWGMLGVASGC